MVKNDKLRLQYDIVIGNGFLLHPIICQRRIRITSLKLYRLYYYTQFSQKQFFAKGTYYIKI